jgi:hypothetical protein
MTNDERVSNYWAQRGTAGHLTPAQLRRFNQNERRSRSGKTHEHIKGQRCYTCRPAKRPTVALRPSRLRPNVRA